MGVHDVGNLSIGQWVAIFKIWNAAHAPADSVAPPSRDEFDAAVARARGLH